MVLDKAVEVAEAIGKKVRVRQKVVSTGVFTAINAAEEIVEEGGFKPGRLCGDAPVAIAPGDFNYVAKWANISRDEWPKLKGVIVSEDFRNGDAYICYFD